MAEDAIFTLRLDPELRDRFVAEADATMRSADEVLRELVQDFVDHRRSARDAEIEQALREADDPRTTFVSDEDVEADWMRERADLLDRIGGGTR